MKVHVDILEISTIHMEWLEKKTKIIKGFLLAALKVINIVLLKS